MQCIRPIKASFNNEGALTFSNKNLVPGLLPIAFPCRKCLPCRLNTAREKGIRAWHESKMHEDSIFLTLTYDDDHLESPWLIYSHWQKFIKDLRDRVGYAPEKRIQTIVTGEYGEKRKRPHWHAILFNYRPKDEKILRTTDRGDQVFHSESLEKIWSRGSIEYGECSIEAASYVARYAAKKLTHGHDQDHPFHPIHKTSSRRAIGRTWIEHNWSHTFENGHIVLPNGQTAGIPRYYSDWLKKTHPEEWVRYATSIRIDNQKKAEQKQKQEEEEYLEKVRQLKGRPRPKTRNDVKLTILNQKFKRLQERLKL